MLRFNGNKTKKMKLLKEPNLDFIHFFGNLDKFIHPNLGISIILFSKAYNATNKCTFEVLSQTLYF